MCFPQMQRYLLKVYQFAQTGNHICGKVGYRFGGSRETFCEDGRG